MSGGNIETSPKVLRYIKLILNTHAACDEESLSSDKPMYSVMDAIGVLGLSGLRFVLRKLHLTERAVSGLLTNFRTLRVPVVVYASKKGPNHEPCEPGFSSGQYIGVLLQLGNGV